MKRSWVRVERHWDHWEGASRCFVPEISRLLQGLGFEAYKKRARWWSTVANLPSLDLVRSSFTVYTRMRSNLSHPDFHQFSVLRPTKVQVPNPKRRSNSNSEFTNFDYCLHRGTFEYRGISSSITSVFAFILPVTPWVPAYHSFYLPCTAPLEKWYDGKTTTNIEVVEYANARNWFLIS